MKDIKRVYYHENKGATEYWDCHINLSKDKAYNFFLALIKFGGSIHSTLALDGGYKTLSRVEVFMRIELPKGAKKDFEEFLGLTLEKPCEVQSNRAGGQAYYGGNAE